MATFNEVFKEYTLAGGVPAGGFNNEDLQGENQHKKVAAIKKIFELAKQNIKSKADTLFADYKVDFVLTASEPAESEIDASMTSGYAQAAQGEKPSIEIPINLDFNKIGKLPPQTAYFIIYSNMHKSLLNKKEQMVSSTGKLINTENENEDSDKEKENQVDSEKSFADIVIDFLIKKLLKFLGLGNENASEYREIAVQYLNDYKQETGKEYSSDFFDFSQTRDADIAELDMTNNKAKEAIEKNDSQLASAYMTQATTLAGAISEDEFKVFVNDETNSQQLKDVCRKYAYAALGIAGVKNPQFVSVTFENRGELGTYYPGKNQVNINLDKIKELNNPAELAMTISHEITHAADARVVRYDKFGKPVYRLAHNMSENIRAADNAPQEVQGFVEELQDICYKVNPNERKARIGELKALEFMVEKFNGDGRLKRSIKASTNNFISYQKSVVRTLENEVSIDCVKKYNQKKNDLVSQYGLDENGPVVKLIKERIDYFVELDSCGKLQPDDEKQSIEVANKLLEELEQANQRKAEAEKQNENVVENEHEQA